MEEGEECDCGWEEDCRDSCCFPQRRYPPAEETPCTLTPGSVCSPSQVCMTLTKKRSSKVGLYRRGNFKMTFLFLKFLFNASLVTLLYLFNLLNITSPSVQILKRVIITQLSAYSKKKFKYLRKRELINSIFCEICFRRFTDMHNVIIRRAARTTWCNFDGSVCFPLFRVRAVPPNVISVLETSVGMTMVAATRVSAMVVLHIVHRPLISPIKPFAIGNWFALWG